MTELHHECKELKDQNEIAIIERYGYTARRFTLAFIGIYRYFKNIIIRNIA